MKPSAFARRGEDRWREIEGMLDDLDRSGGVVPGASRTPALFRQLCGDLSLAQYRMYGLKLCERLNRLVIRGYRHLGRDRSNPLEALWLGLWRDFPVLIREEWRLMCVVMVCFWGPFLGMYFSSFHDMQWTVSCLGPGTMESLETAFGKGPGVRDYRDSFGENFQMFGFYIANNVGIDFRTFAGGILGGVGTLFFVVFNGLHLGAAAGFVRQEGDFAKFLDWISGHSAPEFLGLVFSAMAGFRLGMALIRPGRLTRGHALALAAKRAVKLLYAAAVMTVLAAVIEGFWSPLVLPWEFKFLFGALVTFSLLAWMLLVGKEGRRAD
jgi:uncharacterized membrane protein SpoIIM required for sporulation